MLLRCPNLACQVSTLFSFCGLSRRCFFFLFFETCGEEEDGEVDENSEDFSSIEGDFSSGMDWDFS